MRRWMTGLLSVVLSLPLAANADIVTYDFAWTGNGGYTMTGFFSFDSANAADGAIRDSEVSSLFFEGFVAGSSIGSNAIAPSQTGFNFNFNTVAGQFYLGGIVDDDFGQRWGSSNSGLGFLAGSSNSSVTLNGIGLGSAVNPVPLVATLRTADVPEPATLALVTVSLAALCFQSSRRRKG